jgi:hypothetical protein
MFVVGNRDEACAVLQQDFRELGFPRVNRTAMKIVKPGRVIVWWEVARPGVRGISCLMEFGVLIVDGSLAMTRSLKQRTLGATRNQNYQCMSCNSVCSFWPSYLLNQKIYLIICCRCLVSIHTSFPFAILN